MDVLFNQSNINNSLNKLMLHSPSKLLNAISMHVFKLALSRDDFAILIVIIIS